VANRDIFACFTLANLDALVTAVDVSKQARLKWLNAQKDVPQGRKQEIAERISKLPTPGKYDHFYKVSPLLGPLGGLMLGETEAALRLAVIILLKLTCMMRSHDISTLRPTLYAAGDLVMVRCSAKGSIPRTLSVETPVTRTILKYLQMSAPGHRQTLICHIGSTLCLGPERISKITKNFMTSCGIDTSEYQSHSLRGAVATHLLSRGVDPALIQHRAGWSSGPTAQTTATYYGRAHQTQEWLRLLGAPSDGAFRVGSPFLSKGTSLESRGPLEDGKGVSEEKKETPPNYAEETEEAEAAEGAAEAAPVLVGPGLLVPTGSQTACCGTPVRHEAVVWCGGCAAYLHFRCLAVLGDKALCRECADIPNPADDDAAGSRNKKLRTLKAKKADMEAKRAELEERRAGLNRVPLWAPNAVRKRPEDDAFAEAFAAATLALEAATPAAQDSREAGDAARGGGPRAEPGDRRQKRAPYNPKRRQIERGGGSGEPTTAGSHDSPLPGPPVFDGGGFGPGTPPPTARKNSPLSGPPVFDGGGLGPGTPPTAGPAERCEDAPEDPTPARTSGDGGYRAEDPFSGPSP
jgi:hypothetical protein